MVVQEVYDATTDRNYENTKLSQRYNQEEEKINQPDGSDLYPWLDNDDPRRKMTDEEILEKYVDLTDSDLTKVQKAELVKIMIKYKKVFSLRDEIGTCPKIEVELIRNGLKISPKKYQLFRKTLVYMGHTMIIEDGLPKLKPLKTRIEAILKIEPPKTIKDCRSFCGKVNYLSIYLKDLQLKLIPIYHLTRKGIPFVWGEEQDKAFEDIKKALTSPLVLVMPNSHGHIILVSDTSKIGCGGALYQEIRHVYRLVSYCSKKLSESVQRYSISELELTGLLANISIFKHILKNIKFTVFCDHSALVFIINVKK